MDAATNDENNAIDSHGKDKNEQIQQQSIHTVQSINESFPKIDNLEYFPENVLLRILYKVNDIDLLHLSETSYRFESIAKIVFKKKYADADKYFVFDGETDEQREIYEALLTRFGLYDNVKAVEAKNIQNIGETHWLTQFLRQHTNELQKLAFDRCTFEDANAILQQHMNITHLSLRNGIGQEFLPDYRNLIYLELTGEYEIHSFVQTIRNNPDLESLILHNAESLDINEVLMVIADENLMNLKELDLVGSGKGEMLLQIPVDVMNRLVKSFQKLESLGLSSSNMLYEDDHLTLVQRLSSECKMLKELELKYYFDSMNDDIFEALREIGTLESLSLHQWTYDDEIEPLVECLRKLRHLRLSMQIPNSNAFILSLVHNHPSLETITIETHRPIDDPKRFMNLQFFKQFSQVMQKPHGKVEFKEYGEVVGFVTKKEMVWHNLSGVNLLDLAKPQDASNAFEHILG